MTAKSNKYQGKEKTFPFVLLTRNPGDTCWVSDRQKCFLFALGKWCQTADKLKRATCVGLALPLLSRWHAQKKVISKST